jgi:hypothetical protein
VSRHSNAGPPGCKVELVVTAIGVFGALKIEWLLAGYHVIGLVHVSPAVYREFTGDRCPLLDVSHAPLGMIGSSSVSPAVLTTFRGCLSGNITTFMGVDFAYGYLVASINGLVSLG